MADLFPPAVAVFRSDVGPFIEGLSKANGVTKDWQLQTEKAGVAAQKAGLQAEAAANRAAASQRRAAEAAAAYAKAQNDAAAAAERYAKGEISEAKAADAATAASRRQAVALEAQRTASLNVARAAQAQSDAQIAAARVASVGIQRAAVDAATVQKAQAKAAGDAQAAALKKQEAAAASFSKGFNKAGKASTLILAGIGIASIKLAGDFQQQTNVLVTAAGELPKNLASVRTGILDIASATGTAWQKVTESVYDAEKAGFRGADSLKVARAASQAAREEGADLTTVTGGLTRALSAYNLKGSDAVRVTNALKTGAGEAHATFQDYTAGIGSFLSRAAAAKISLPDALGVYSSVTQQVGAQQAAQNLGSTIGNLSNVKGPQVTEFGQLGIDVVDFEKKLGDGPGGRGLVGSLNLLSQTVLQKMGPAGTLLLSTFNQSQLAAKDAGIELANLPPAAQKVAKAYADGSLSLKDYRTGLKALPADQASLAQQFVVTENKAKGFQSVLRAGGPQAQTYLAALRLLTGGQEGLTVALAATGQNADKTNDRVKRVAASFATGGKDVQGWAITQKNFNVQFDQFKQQAERVGIQLGNQLIPKVEGLFRALSKHPAVLKDIVTGLEFMAGAWLAIKFGNLITGLSSLASRLLGVSAAARTAAASTSALAGAEGAAGAAGAAEGAGVGAGAAAGAGAGLAEGAAAGGLLARARAGIGKSPLLRIAIPVVVTIGALKVLGLSKAADDLIHGDIQKAFDDSPAWTNVVAGGLGKALRLTKLPGTQGLFTGNLSGKQVDSSGAVISKGSVLVRGEVDDAATAFKQAGNSAENWWKTVDDRARIADFQKGLKNAGALLDSNTNSLIGNSAGAASNRAGLISLANQAKQAASAYARTTGNQDDYTRSLRLALPAIENAAAATGLDKGQVDALVRSIFALPPERVTKVGVSGADAAAASLYNLQNQLRLLAQPVIIPILTQSSLTGVASPSFVPNIGQIITAQNNNLGASGPGGVPGGVGHASGGLLRGPGTGTSDSIPLWGSNGEYMIRESAVKQYGVGFFDAVNAGKYAAGGLLQDLSILGNFTHAQNTILGYNKANFAHATAANAPGLQLAAQNAAAVAHAVGAYFNLHKAALFSQAHSGSAAQRKAAGSVYNELANFAHITSSDAAQEAALAVALRRKYAGPEANPLSFGAASRNLSYLSLAGSPTVQTPSHMNVTVVSTLDGKEIARNTSTHQLRVEKNNLSNGATRIRNP